MTKHSVHLHVITDTQRDVIGKLRTSPYFIRKIEDIYTLNEFIINVETINSLIRKKILDPGTLRLTEYGHKCNL